MPCRLFALLCFAAAVLSAADFENFQAARAVIGQSSFSSHDKGVTARALTLAKGNLNVADDSGRLLTFDLSRMGAPHAPACPVCLTAAQSSINQPVIEGIAAFAVNGRTIAIADSKNHRVILKRNSADVILTSFTQPISIALDNQRLFVGDAAAHHVYIWNSLPTYDAPPDVTLGIPESTDGPGADTLQIPAALASDGANLYVADAAAHRVLVFSPADTPAPRLVNAATLQSGPVAPGTLVAIDRAASGKTTVLLNGTALESAEQLQFQVPFNLNASAAAVWIQTESEDGAVTTSRPAALRLTAVSPGIFAFGTHEPRSGLLVHSPEGIPLTSDNPARPSELIAVWATGLGAVASAPDADGGFQTLTPVRAALNGNSIEVVSARLPADSSGVYEVVLRMPDPLPANATLNIFQNDSKSNTVKFLTSPPIN